MKTQNYEEIVQGIVIPSGLSNEDVINHLSIFCRPKHHHCCIVFDAVMKIVYLLLIKTKFGLPQVLR